MLRRVTLAGVALIGAALLLLASWPQLIGVQRALPWAELTAMRGLIGVVALAAAALLVIAGGASRRIRSLAILLGVVYLGIVVLNVLVLSLRGFGPGPAADAESGDVTVFSWNTLSSAVSADIVTERAERTDADVIVLTETSREEAEIVVALFDQQGRSFQLFVHELDTADPRFTAALLVSDELGAYRLLGSDGAPERMPAVIAVPVDGDGPTLIAAHPAAPIPAELELWQAGIAWLAVQCDRPEVILAGDLNATLDHFAGLGAEGFELGHCRDAARGAGAGAIGTWPSTLPALLGAPIDHVLTSAGWQAVAVEIGEADASDHRPLVAVLRPQD